MSTRSKAHAVIFPVASVLVYFLFGLQFNDSLVLVFALYFTAILYLGIRFIYINIIYIYFLDGSRRLDDQDLGDLVRWWFIRFVPFIPERNFSFVVILSD